MTRVLDRPHDHEERIAQARARSTWELGDESWADVILLAYFDPDMDREKLEDEYS